MNTRENSQEAARKVRKVAIILSTGSYQREAPTTVLRLAKNFLNGGSK